MILILSTIECPIALGMENGKISDEKISASSELSVNHAAIQARLNFKVGSWVSATNDAAQWLQIDLENYYTLVTSVATQGRDQDKQWVKRYNLQYSDDAVNFTYYVEQGQSAVKVNFSFFFFFFFWKFGI